MRLFWESMTSRLTHKTSTVYACDFQLLEVVDRGSETQLQVTENALVLGEHDLPINP